MSTTEQTQPKFDTLLAMADWWTKQPFAVPPSQYGGVHKAGVFTGITLFRQGQFQAQLWLCPPNSEIPDHAHPHVDIVQFYVSGQVYLRLNGETVIKPEDLGELTDGRANKNGRWIRVRGTDTHGATIGPLGGAFITLQEWAPGISPKSVELDWEGEALDEAHDAALKQQ